MMTSLDTIQQDFQNFVLGQLDETGMLPHIAATSGLATRARLSIYYDAYRIRLREALSEAFDKTHRYLGDDLFYELCAAYIEQHPSQKRNLRWYGAQFSDFLAQQLKDYLVVSELAAFEWALSLAFDAEDQVILTLADLATLDEAAWGTIGFHCQASVHFLDTYWNSVPIWLALNEEQTPPVAMKGDVSVSWLIWRKQLQPHFRSLSGAEHQALLGLCAGHSFSDVCTVAATNNPDVTEQIAGWLHTWVTEEVFSR